MAAKSVSITLFLINAGSIMEKTLAKPTEQVTMIVAIKAMP